MFTIKKRLHTNIRTYTFTEKQLALLVCSGGEQQTTQIFSLRMHTYKLFICRYAGILGYTQAFLRCNFISYANIYIFLSRLLVIYIYYLHIPACLKYYLCMYVCYRQNHIWFFFLSHKKKTNKKVHTKPTICTPLYLHTSFTYEYLKYKKCRHSQLPYYRVNYL